MIVLIQTNANLILSCTYSISISGHAATSIGLLTFILLELLMYHPNVKGKKQARVNSNAITTTRANVAPSYTIHSHGDMDGNNERVIMI